MTSPNPPSLPHGRATGVAVLATQMADLPEHRQQLLLLRHVGDPDFPDILPHRLARIRCGGIPSKTYSLPEGARLGSDGRYHLSTQGLLGCNPHEYSQLWATDGRQYQRQQPQAEWGLPRKEQRWVTAWTDVEWSVNLDESSPLVPLSSVAPNERCPIPQETWPRPLDRSPRGRVRAALVAELGDLCSICQAQYGWAIDHDPLTHQVRGYLCRRCNDLVDFCVHSSGCPYGDYVDHPPAAHLELVHPDSSWRRNDRGSRHWQAWLNHQSAQN